MMKHMRLLFALAAVLTFVAALACTSEVVKEVEVPGETVVVEREVIKEVQVPSPARRWWWRRRSSKR